MTCSRRSCACHGVAQAIESSMWEDDRRLPISYVGSDPAVRKRIDAAIDAVEKHPVGRCDDAKCACQFRLPAAK